MVYFLRWWSISRSQAEGVKKPSIKDFIFCEPEINVVQDFRGIIVYSICSMLKAQYSTTILHLFIRIATWKHLILMVTHLFALILISWQIKVWQDWPSPGNRKMCILGNYKLMWLKINWFWGMKKPVSRRFF